MGGIPGERAEGGEQMVGPGPDSRGSKSLSSLIVAAAALS